MLSLAKQREEAHKQTADSLKPKGISGMVQKGLRRVTGNRFGVTDTFNNRMKEIAVSNVLSFLKMFIKLEVMEREAADLKRKLEKTAEDLRRVMKLCDGEAS